ncbi:MAG: thermonuclease family protein [Magnetococcales bacterium]|nr:thermonuclease family protein [Magnetococcales bacterium]
MRRPGIVKASSIFPHLSAILTLLVLTFPIPGSAGVAVLSGVARVMDGDSLHLDRATVRLFGIDAWERRQTCPDGEGNPFACGEEATRFLTDLVSGKKLTCRVQDQDSYGRQVARCLLPGGEDIGRQLVQAGWATAYIHYSKEYSTDEKQARSQRLGGWKGLPRFRPQSPNAWRRHRR